MLLPITLHDNWKIENPEDYKVHFARNNQHAELLEVWVRSEDEWREWQEYRPVRNDFNRALIFALMKFYHDTDA